jgi:hypothetical protein
MLLLLLLELVQLARQRFRAMMGNEGCYRGKYYGTGSAFYEVWSGRLLPDAPTPNGG